jgi:glycosyltransferase involved in cell wall biosynthesis
MASKYSSYGIYSSSRYEEKNSGSSKMNYYLFTTDLRRAGAQHVVSILAERWSRNAKVTIILLLNEVEFNLPAAVRVIALECATDPLHFYSGMMMRQAKRKLYAILAENKGPFAFYSFLESPNFISVLLKRKFPNGIFIGSSRVNLFLYNRIFHMLYPCYKYLDAFIVNSQTNQRLFIDKFGLPAGKVFFIPNPINFASIERQANEKIPAILAQLIGKKPLILAAGRLVKQKNFALLLRAFARMPVKENAAHLIILGAGPEQRALLRLAKRLGITSRLTMPGKVTNPYVWMANIDLFVLSSNFEGWPNVLVEAMVIGMPVVACDCPTGPAEILRNGAFGLLVPTDNAEALAVAMAKQLFQGKKEYPFLREWDADAIAERYRMVAEDILKQRKS